MLHLSCNQLQPLKTYYDWVFRIHSFNYKQKSCYCVESRILFEVKNFYRKLLKLQPQNCRVSAKTEKKNELIVTPKANNYDFSVEKLDARKLIKT